MSQIRNLFDCKKAKQRQQVLPHCFELQMAYGKDVSNYDCQIDKVKKRHKQYNNIIFYSARKESMGQTFCVE